MSKLSTIKQENYLLYSTIRLLPRHEQKNHLEIYSKKELIELEKIYIDIREIIRKSKDQNILYKEVVNEYFQRINLIKKNKINFIDSCNK